MKFLSLVTTALSLVASAVLVRAGPCLTTEYPLVASGAIIVGNIQIFAAVDKTILVVVSITGDLTPDDPTDDSSLTKIYGIVATTSCPPEPGTNTIPASFTYAAGETSVSFNLDEPNCGGENNEVLVDVEADVRKLGAMQAFNDLFPVEVSFTPQTNAGSTAVSSYWDLTFATGPLANLGPIDGYCVDVGHYLTPGVTVNGWALSYLETDTPSIADSNIDKKGTLYAVAWLINNFKPGNTYGTPGPTSSYTMTSGTMQRAIWYIVDNTQETSGLGAYNEAWAKYMRDQALSHTDFVPGCGHLIPIFIIGNPNYSAIQNVFIQTTFVALKIPCDQGDKAIGEASKICEPTDKQPPPSVWGDPHFKTWTGRDFDYHGECDLVLLEDARHNTTIHVRATSRYAYSYISGAAIQINEDVLEVGSWGNYFLNDINMAELSGTFGGHPISLESNGDKVRTFKIQIDDEQSIEIKTFKDMVAVKLNVSPAHFAHSKGLLGDAYSGKKLGRDGVTEFIDDKAYGQEWQVRAHEPKLFHMNREPQFPQVCVLPAADAGSYGSNMDMEWEVSGLRGRRRLVESAITLEDAERACANWVVNMDSCVFDVMATGDLEVADAGVF